MYHQQSGCHHSFNIAWWYEMLLVLQTHAPVRQLADIIVNRTVYSIIYTKTIDLKIHFKNVTLLLGTLYYKDIPSENNVDKKKV